eukprot:5813313-Prymnesium_polylepis.1
MSILCGYCRCRPERTTQLAHHGFPGERCVSGCGWASGTQAFRHGKNSNAQAGTTGGACAP